MRGLVQTGTIGVRRIFGKQIVEVAEGPARNIFCDNARIIVQTISGITFFAAD